jgi:hypothetical protein
LLYSADVDWPWGQFVYAALKYKNQAVSPSTYPSSTHQFTPSQLPLSTNLKPIHSQTITMSDTYKPTGELPHITIFQLQQTHIITEHDGLKQDGTPDKRVGTGGTL